MKLQKRRRKNEALVKLPHKMSFEDAVKHVLKAGPMPKTPKKSAGKKKT